MCVTRCDDEGTASLPGWRDIAEAICNEIRSGAIPVGESIPSTAKLMQTHGVAQRTVRGAVKHLTAAGVLRGEAGRGVYVAKVPDPGLPKPVDPLSVLEIKLTARIDDLARRLDEHECDHPTHAP